MKTVRIYGTAANLVFAPPVPPGVEVWAVNAPKHYHRFRPHTKDEYTRWFNLHSRRHMVETYPRGYQWFATQTKPIVLQEVQADISASVAFPREEILRHFGVRYFTFSGAWLFALAIYEGFERIEFYGFSLRDKPQRPHSCYKFERPCFFYWSEVAKARGITVVWPQDVEDIKDKTPGDPTAYAGPLYGYETT